MAPGIAVVTELAAVFAGGACVLLADLHNPAIAPLLALPATPRDHDDMRRPLAGRATFFLRRRALLRHVVARWCGVAADVVRVGHDGDGAPRVLAPEGPFVSVSARDSLCALAIAARPIGVDIEPLDPPAEVEWSVLHATEAAALAVLPARDRTRAFLTLWTAKEAALKARGLGLTRDPAALAVTVSGTGLRIADPTRDTLDGRRFDATIGNRIVVGACVTLGGQEPREGGSC